MTLLEYASQDSLSQSAVYTIEVLIEYVAWRLEGHDYGLASERDEARKQPGYVSHFSMRELERSLPHIMALTWLNLQNSSQNLSDLTPVGFLSELTGLFLSYSSIADIQPLSALQNLRRLHLDNNPIQDLSPLATLSSLTELKIDAIESNDFTPLTEVPMLDELTIGADQLECFKRCEHFATLRFLHVHDLFDRGTPIISFWGFPEMPELRKMASLRVQSFDGIEKFPRLCNLTNVWGGIEDLTPLAKLPELTHFNFLESNVRSLAPLTANHQLRSIIIKSDQLKDASPLRQLPQLRSANISGKKVKTRSIEKLQASLSSWDADFQADSKQAEPSPELKIVSQAQFDLYDTKEPFGVADWDGNRSMLSSEADWIESLIEEKLKSFLTYQDDFYLFGQVRYSRSTTVTLYSEKTTSQLADVVALIQECLCWAKHEWIIYLHTDMWESGSEKEDFQCWVYRDHLEATAEYVEQIRQLFPSS